MRVLFFAQLKDATRCEAVEFYVSTPLTSGELWTKLIQQFPSLMPHRDSVRLAKNCEYIQPDAQFTDDDEVALIPPVSGG